ncbi:MAG: ABC transporter permease subunit [Ignavibacteria bacterium]
MYFLNLILFTLRETLAKKVIISFFIISTLIIISYLFFVNIDSVEGLMTFLKESDVKQARTMVLNSMIFMLDISYLMIITLCVVAVSTLIPDMLKSGNIELLLSKPISRDTLIFSKFVAGLVLVFFSLLYLLGGVWLIVSLKSGYWHIQFLYSVFWLTYSFAVIYSLVILLGVLTRNSVITIILTIVYLFILSPILSAREKLIFSFVSGNVVKFIFNFLYYVFPKPVDLQLFTREIVSVSPISTYQPVITSFIFMVAALSLSVLIFRKRDF